MDLIWKREKPEAGLRGIGAAPPGSRLYDGRTCYAITLPLGGGKQGRVRGWYWCTMQGSGMQHRDTRDMPCVTEDKAKLEARQYVLRHLSTDGKSRSTFTRSLPLGGQPRRSSATRS